MGRQNSSKKKNGSAAGWIIAAVIVFLFNVLKDSSGDSDMIIGLIAVIVVLAVIVTVVSGIVKAAKKSAAKQSGDKFSSDRAERFSAHDQNAEMFKKRSGSAFSSQTGAPARAAAPERKYYDGNAENENFERDKERRLAQLDEFLKNGVIDKSEYRTLRSRYEGKR